MCQGQRHLVAMGIMTPARQVHRGKCSDTVIDVIHTAGGWGGGSVGSPLFSSHGHSPRTSHFYEIIKTKKHNQALLLVLTLLLDWQNALVFVTVIQWRFGQTSALVSVCRSAESLVSFWDWQTGFQGFSVIFTCIINSYSSALRDVIVYINPVTMLTLHL